MTTPNSSSNGDTTGTNKSDDLNQDPPILMATTLPPESAFETVMIDDDEDLIAQETTPLVPVFYNGGQSVHTNGANPSPVIPEEDDGNDEMEDSKPADDGPIFRDWIFGVLFYIQVLVVIVCGMVYSPRGYEKIDQIMNYTLIREQIESESDDMTPEQWNEFDTFVAEVSEYISSYAIRILLWTILPCALFAFFWVHVTLIFVVRPFAKFVVRSSLVLTVFATLALVLLLVVPSLTPGSLVVGTTLCGAIIYYVHLVWSMIPFAAVNLKVAVIGINANMGSQIWAFFFCKVGLLWILYWLYATFGILSYLDDQCKAKHGSQNSGHSLSSAKGNGADDDCGQGGIFFLLLLSGYWTTKVLMNTVEVTVAGVMATWCYDKEAASGCCSAAVGASLFRSATYSFGSICFGSLLQGLMQVLRNIIPDPRTRRANNDQTCCGLCFCICECCGRVLEDVLNYFHQWAYVFVGIYGYGYVESGRKVLELFVSKGWTAIISERLASYVTGCITLAIGVLTGLSGWACTILVDYYHDPHPTSSRSTSHDGSIDSTYYVYGPVPRYASFFLGFALGTVTASVMMSVVRGGLNTLVVCFADAPAQLEENHPELTQEMIEAWAKSFPELIQPTAFEPPTAEPVATEARPV